MRVDIWSDIVCPWCYVGKRRFETALAAFDGAADLEVIHHAFQLNPDAPLGATSNRRDMLMKKYTLTHARVEAMDARMTEVAAQEGLDYHLEGTVTGNTLDAHQLVHLARDQGRQDAMIERLYRAYFIEQRSIFDQDSLADLADETGLDRETARDTLREGRYVSAVHADIDVARHMGITGVPFFAIAGRYGVSGAQPPEVFLEGLTRAAGDDAAN